MATPSGRHYPILAYALALIALMLGSLGVAVTYGVRQMADVEAQVAERGRYLANEEIEKALEAVGLSVDHYLMWLSDWDEVRQQLIDPTYYGYWIAP